MGRKKSRKAVELLDVQLELPPLWQEQLKSTKRISHGLPPDPFYFSGQDEWDDEAEDYEAEDDLLEPVQQSFHPQGTIIVGKKQGSYRPEGIPIECLRPGDTICSWVFRDGCLCLSSKITEITKKDFIGDMVQMKTSRAKLSCTSESLCIVSFNSFKRHHCVYSMKKGVHHRVGMSQFSGQKTDVSGPVSRLATEKADAMWILGFYETREEAFIMEQSISGRFGLPQLVFNDECIRTKGLTEKAWNYIGDNSDKAEDCLSFFGKNINLPLFTKESSYRSLKRPMKTSVTNLMDGCLIFSLVNCNQITRGSKKEATTVQLDTEFYSGEIYSLTMDKYFTYIANGIICHAKDICKDKRIRSYRASDSLMAN